ncbi:glycosyltransferase family 4 protein [Oryzobacter sp. R7]|uniref:glycosyltransferase family 4 protein n=1 Tax=Oryzobacter faecalis TaxID=3388656 RepID=UPI00398CA3C0
MTSVVLAANNGDVGGGEVMLRATAGLLADLGVHVEVVGPSVPGGVLDLVEADGHPVHRLAADRRRYAGELRAWHAGRPEVLWCHGLVPALATAGRSRRVVHLHQLPTGSAQRAALVTARARSSLVLVPSDWMAARVPAARVLPNWTADPGFARRTPGRQRRLGYLGRHSVDKGLVVLARALARPGSDADVRLVLAGGPRFVDDAAARAVADALAPLGDRVERVGWVEPAALLRDVDGLVVPSVAPESFGLAAAEAMAAGVPCLVSDAGALPEVVGGGHPWVVPAGDVEALAAAVGGWAAAPADDLDALARTQRVRWERHFSPGAARARVADVLAALQA